MPTCVVCQTNEIENPEVSCVCRQCKEGTPARTTPRVNDLAALRAERDALLKIYDIAASCDVFSDLLDTLMEEDAVLWAQLDAAIAEVRHFKATK